MIPDVIPFFDEIILGMVTLMLARGLRKNGHGGGDASEKITVHEVPLQQVNAFLRGHSRDGAAIDVVGSIPVAFADFGIRTPDGFGWLGSVSDHGVAEFLLVLER